MFKEENKESTKRVLKTMAYIGNGFIFGAVVGPVVGAWSGVMKIAAAVCTPVSTMAFGHAANQITDQACEEIVDNAYEKVNKWRPKLKRAKEEMQKAN